METELINSDRVTSFFNSLETHKLLLTKCTDLYKTISTNFTSLQQTLISKSQTLDSKFQTLNSQTQKTLNSLTQYEDSLPGLESSVVTHINELKNSALLEIQSTEPIKNEFLEVVKLYAKIMSCSELLKYLIRKRKETMTMRVELITVIVENCVDVFRLMLDGVEEFLEVKEMKVGVADKRWGCGVLIQGLFEYGEELGVKGVKGVSKSMVERGLKVVEKWKGMVEVEEQSSGGGVMGASEAVMFLQMVVVFGLKGKFEEEYLKKLVMGFSSRRDMAKIVVALGFKEKMGDIIDELVKNGKEIEAVYFSSESGLTEHFPPVDLLKSYLRTSRKNATTILKNGNYSAAATDEASALELNSIRAIIKCVEDHKLESQFTIDSLKKRIPQLEKAKADRKKMAATTTKPSNKRSHGGGGRSSGPLPPRSSKSARYSNVSPSYGRRNPSQSHLVPAARYAAPYNYASQNVYEGPTTASYGAGYGGSHSQSPAALPQQYSYPSQDVGTGGIRAGGSYNTPTNYGGYDYGAAAPPAYPPYPPQ